MVAGATPAFATSTAQRVPRYADTRDGTSSINIGGLVFSTPESTC